MSELTKAEIMEKLVKLLQTDRDMSFLMLLDEMDLTTLLVALRERIEIRKLLDHDQKRYVPANSTYRRQSEHSHPVR